MIGNRPNEIISQIHAEYLHKVMQQFTEFLRKNKEGLLHYICWTTLQKLWMLFCLNQGTIHSHFQQ